MIGYRSRSGPGPAELSRTALGHAPLLAVRTRGAEELVAVRGVDVDGSVVLLVAADGPLVRDLCEPGTPEHGPCSVDAALLSPVPAADRVLHTLAARGLLELAEDVEAALAVVLRAHPGRPDVVLRPDASALLRFHPAALDLDGRPVDPAASAAAEADPLAADSDEVVTHLLHDHPAEVARLAFLLDPALLEHVRALAPVRVDRYGLTVRVDSPAGTTLTRLDFPAALRGPAELPAAMRKLGRRAAQVTGCPRRDAVPDAP